MLRNWVETTAPWTSPPVYGRLKMYRWTMRIIIIRLDRKPRIHQCSTSTPSPSQPCLPFLIPPFPQLPITLSHILSVPISQPPTVDTPQHNMSTKVIISQIAIEKKENFIPGCHENTDKIPIPIFNKNFNSYL